MSALLAELLPYLLAFYVFDGLTVVRLRQAWFVSLWRRFRRPDIGYNLLGLAPWSEAFAVDDGSVLMLPAGLALFRPEARYQPALLEASDIELVPWEQVGEVHMEGRRVVSGSRALCTLPTRNAARVLTLRIAAVLQAEPQRRADEIQAQQDRATDPAALREVLLSTRWLRRILAVSGPALFAVMFVLLPASLYTPLGAHLSVTPLLLVVLLGVLLTVGVGTALAVRGGMRSEIAHLVVPLFFFPPGAARALAHFTSGMLARFDVAAVAAALLPRLELATRAHGELNRARLGRERAKGTELEPWFLERERAWRRAVDGLGMPSAEVLAAPRLKDKTAERYCPLCVTEYRSGFETCKECGVALVSPASS